MKTGILAFAALAGLATSAMAGTVSSTNQANGAKGNFGQDAIVGSSRGLVTYDLGANAITSNELLGDPNNMVIAFDLAAAMGQASGTAVTMTGIGWDVNLETVGGSWLSEAIVYFDDNIAPDALGLFLTPSATAAPGIEFNSSGGIVDLTDNGIADIVLPDGILRMEFHESFDDAPGADAFWTGTLTIAAVPTPGALSLLGLGGLAAMRRRR